VHIRHDDTPIEGQGRQRGQALVEFAFVAPMLILLLMAIFQFAFVLQAQMGLTNAVREAARRAAATTASSEASFSSWTAGQMTGGSGLLATNVQSYDSTRIVGSPSVTFCTYSINGTTSDRVKVTVTYRYPVFFPLLSFATDAIDGTSDGAWTLAATAEMRVENAQAWTPASSC
jgi:Flp pilus assembly protein TadG